MTRNVLESDVYKEMDAVLNPSLQYPDYYLSPFHAYDEGNLSWLAVAEAEPATMSMVFRAVPDASTVEEANEIVRGNWLRAIEHQHQNYSGGSTVRDILDVGCSVGVSTRFLADKFPSANVTESSIDLSSARTSSQSLHICVIAPGLFPNTNKTAPVPEMTPTSKNSTTIAPEVDYDADGENNLVDVEVGEVDELDDDRIIAAAKRHLKRKRKLVIPLTTSSDSDEA
ncbi:hypothetical protein LINPERPRIM_LOCUS5855 [Linum perenne]